MTARSVALYVEVANLRVFESAQHAIIYKNTLRKFRIGCNPNLLYTVEASVDVESLAGFPRRGVRCRSGCGQHAAFRDGAPSADIIGRQYPINLPGSTGSRVHRSIPIRW